MLSVKEWVLKKWFAFNAHYHFADFFKNEGSQP
jgi:hypothetical protein